MEMTGMPKITINDVVCEYEGQKTILQIAKANGIPIPHYCYHDALSITASCRICLAEVSMPNPRNDNKLEPVPKLLPTCQTMAGDGHVVTTQSDKAVANQKAVMELLLINHPLDCPQCDQAGECALQDHSHVYGTGVSRFVDDKIVQDKKDLGDDVYLYSNRCIMCTRCVRFTREVTETSELCVVGRGSGEEIDLFPGIALDNPMSGNVVDICPVGALLDKDFQFQQRVWFLDKANSIDGLTAGGDNISIESSTDGIIRRVKPRINTAVNKWWISNEVRYGWHYIHSDNRITHPIHVQYGDAVECSWDDAYSEINEALSAIKARGGKVAALISPMLPCEEAFAIANYAMGWHENPADAVLGVGEIPVEGEDITYPPGAKPEDELAYTIRAEKAPNARGVRRVLDAITAENDQVYDFESFLVAAKKADAIILTGNYPEARLNKDLVKILAKKFVVLVDTLRNDKLFKKVTVVLPGATWAEKAGTFENDNNLLQAFAQAIPPVGSARSEGQIFTELAHIASDGSNSIIPVFSVGEVQTQLTETYGETAFANIAVPPVHTPRIESDMQLIQL